MAQQGNLAYLNPGGMQARKALIDRYDIRGNVVRWINTFEHVARGSPPPQEVPRAEASKEN